MTQKAFEVLNEMWYPNVCFAKSAQVDVVDGVGTVGGLYEDGQSWFQAIMVST